MPFGIVAGAPPVALAEHSVLGNQPIRYGFFIEDGELDLQMLREGGAGKVKCDRFLFLFNVPDRSISRSGR